jgi:polyphosphate kinase 2
MAFSLKEYDNTEYAYVYISKSTTKWGYKYICKFIVEDKTYTKTLGYSIKDELTHELANDKFLAYKKEIKENIKQKPITSSLNISDEDKASLQKIALNYYKLFGSISKVELALKRRYQRNKLVPYQVELIKLQEYLEKSNQKMTIVFEGRDASGKGGAIRTLARYMNSKHCRIVALGKPTDTERNQWFFQKYVRHFPITGEVVLFDRSWYNRAMVEPVFDFCSKDEYKVFFNDVKEFERSIVRSRTKLIKIYYSVTKEIQAQRFENRKKDPLRQWKLSEVDLQAQDLWDVFTKKKYKMLRDTEIQEAPWHIIRSNDKYLTRLESIKVILNSVDYPNKNQDLDYEPNKLVLFSASEELKFMKI